jgi:hypothetical protein
MTASDPNSIYFYNPSLPAAVLFTALYAIPTAFLFWRTLVRPKALYLLCLPFAGVFEVAGYAARDVSVKNVESVVSIQPIMKNIPASYICFQ